MNNDRLVDPKDRRRNTAHDAPAERFCALLDVYFNALVRGGTQTQIDTARLDVIAAYEARGATQPPASPGVRHYFDNLDAVSAAIQQLPQASREALLLSRQGLEETEIATRLDISVDTIRALIAGALFRIHEETKRGGCQTEALPDSRPLTSAFIGVSKIACLAVAHIDMDALRISHAKDWEILIAFAEPATKRSGDQA